MNTNHILLYYIHIMDPHTLIYIVLGTFAGLFVLISILVCVYVVKCINEKSTPYTHSRNPIQTKYTSKLEQLSLSTQQQSQSSLQNIDNIIVE